MSDKLLTTGWSVRRKATAFQELAGSSGDQWQQVTLPHDALVGMARRADAPNGHATGYFPSGAFEYKRVLPAEDTPAGHLVALEFDGVYRDAAVYVNGALAGRHAYGYSRFVVRLDPYLRPGVDNEVRVTCRAHEDSRWYTGAGIYRDVRLITKDPVRIAVDGITVTTVDADAEAAVVEVATIVENGSLATVTARVSTAIHDDAATAVATDSSPVTVLPGERQVVRHRVLVNTPALWSPDGPALYTAHVTLEAQGFTDRERVAFGIRTLQLDASRGLRLNGDPIKLRGACIHADNGPLGAAAIRAAEERKVRLLKEAGFNAIRMSHHPSSSALLDACDRLGMLVMDELTDMWTSGKSDDDYSFDFPDWWERDIEAMVAKDRNHPSVIMYSIGNEIPELGDPHGARWGRMLAEKVRALDPTRYVTNGVNGFVAVLDTVLTQMKARRAQSEDGPGGGVNQMMSTFGDMMNQISASEMVSSRIEESLAVLDIAGYNYGAARYARDLEERPSRVVLGSETWPRDIASNWAAVQQLPHVLGDFTWTGLDYLGEVGIGLTQYAGEMAEGASGFVAPFPGLTAWCGDLDITGSRRSQSHYRERVFGLAASPHIAVQRPARHGQDIAVSTPWSWSDTVSSWSWPGHEGATTAVEVYADAEEVDLLLDGVSIGRAPVGVSRPLQADFEVTYRPGELTAVAYREGVEVGRTSLTTASSSLRLAATPEEDSIGASPGDLGFVAITLVDDNGIAQPLCDRQVRVSVDGAGELAALGTGRPVTAEAFSDHRCTTFDGRALAIVRPTGAGKIRVTVEADGCDSVEALLLAVDAPSPSDAPAPMAPAHI